MNHLKVLFLTLSSPFILSSVIILSIFGAQAKLSNLKIDLFGQTMHSSELHDPNSEACEGMEFNSAEEAFLYAEQLSKAGSSGEEAIAAYTCAIQLDPQMAKAYVFRSLEFALIPGQEHLGIEDGRKASEILRAQGNEEMARAMDQQVNGIQELIAERERGLALRKHYGIEATSEVDENWRREAQENSTRPWSEKRGIEGDHRHQSILVKAPLDVLSVALEKRAIASQRDVLNSEVEVSGPFAFAYQIPGQGWSVVAPSWNSNLLERATLTQLSEELGQPVIALDVGEGEIDYDWFEAGVLVEHFKGHEGEPLEEYEAEGLQTQRYVLAVSGPYASTMFQTAYFWSSRRSVTAREIGSIGGFVQKLLLEAEAFDPAIDYEYLLGTYSSSQDNLYRVQNPGFITVYPSGEERFVPDLGRVDYFKFEH